MLRCNLALLLAERGLKISKVSKDTGISRTTLTALANNTSQGIQLETIDKLCMYLKTDVASFFVFHPSTISFSLNNKKDDVAYLSLTIKHNSQIYKVLFETYVVPIYIDDPDFKKAKNYSIELYLMKEGDAAPPEFVADSEWEFGNEWFAKQYYPKLPIIFKTDIENRIKNAVIKEFNIPDDVETVIYLDFLTEYI